MALALLIADPAGISQQDPTHTDQPVVEGEIRPVEDDPAENAKRKRPKNVPKTAGYYQPTPTLHVFHWTEDEPDRNRKRVLSHLVVDEWPEKGWGVEAILTPIPFCCGAQQTRYRWLKSRTIRPCILAFLPPESSYQLTVRFIESGCPHCQ